MSHLTLHELQCFDAVLRAGSFQAAAALLHRSHPAVFAAVAKLEKQLGLALLDRSGYRVRPTEAGLSLHKRAQALLIEMEQLDVHARQLALGEESDLRVVIGDLCPPPLLELLCRFFAECPATRLHLHFEAVTGPWERLLDDEADLILHRINKTDTRLEWLDLCEIPFVPVVAADFLPFPVTRQITAQQMRKFTQCIVRDSARHSPDHSHYIVPGAHQCTVPDQVMKKQVILHGLAWGHMPRFVVEEELREGRLVSIAGRYLQGMTEQLVAARRRDRPHGPVANRLWSHIEAQTPQVRKLLAGAAPGAAKKKARPSARATLRRAR